MAEEVPKNEAPEAKVDAEFLRVSAEMRRLERAALPKVEKGYPQGPVFGDFDIENISINSYEAALESAKSIEGTGIKGKEKKQPTRKEEKQILSDEDIQLIPVEKIEVVARSQEEILQEEEKLDEMKNKFARLISEIPKEKPEEKMTLEKAAVKAEEKPSEISEAKAEEIRQLSENFKNISMKKEEREKRERIRKMKKEIDDILDSG